ncbi:MAG TPA: hypothetical protein PK361_09620, partial [Chiayiivirga sp.]|nr:hypothetical protein [Chiayiivirga sp.]
MVWLASSPGREPIGSAPFSLCRRRLTLVPAATVGARRAVAQRGRLVDSRHGLAQVEVAFERGADQTFQNGVAQGFPPARQFGRRRSSGQGDVRLDPVALDRQCRRAG